MVLQGLVKKRSRLARPKRNKRPCFHCGTTSSSQWYILDKKRCGCISCGSRITRARASGAISVGLPSSISGTGLFVLKDVQARDFICYYSGDSDGAPAPAVQTTETQDELVYAATVRGVSENAKFSRYRWTADHQGALCNCARGTGQSTNARLSIYNNRLAIIATVSIKKFTEVLISYGVSYWANYRQRQ